MKKIIYISGPYRSPTEWGRILNIRLAEEAALDCWMEGWVAICPHKNTEHFGGAIDDDVLIEGDLEILRRCDAILMIPAWGRSVGATKEHDLAKKMGIPVYYTIDEVPTIDKDGNEIDWRDRHNG